MTNDKHPGRWIVERSLRLAGLDPYRDYSVRGTEIRTAADYILQLEADLYLLKQKIDESDQDYKLGESGDY